MKELTDVLQPKEHKSRKALAEAVAHELGHRRQRTATECVLGLPGRCDGTVGIKVTTFATMTDGALGFIVPGLITTSWSASKPGHPQWSAVELLRAGTFREEAARIAARQRYAGDAHMNLYYFAPLPSVLERHGDRGYRLAQLEGALHAGKLHLGTHALGLGAVGSTAFDDEVVEFFSPHAQGQDYMFVTVFGKRRHSASVVTHGKRRDRRVQFPSFDVGRGSGRACWCNPVGPRRSSTTTTTTLVGTTWRRSRARRRGSDRFRFPAPLRAGDRGDRGGPR